MGYQLFIHNSATAFLATTGATRYYLAAHELPGAYLITHVLSIGGMAMRYACTPVHVLMWRHAVDNAFYFGEGYASLPSYVYDTPMDYARYHF